MRCEDVPESTILSSLHLKIGRPSCMLTSKESDSLIAAEFEHSVQLKIGDEQVIAPSLQIGGLK